VHSDTPCCLTAGVSALNNGFKLFNSFLFLLNFHFLFREKRPERGFFVPKNGVKPASEAPACL
jgi:hypothetical protein